MLRFAAVVLVFVASALADDPVDLEWGVKIPMRDGIHLNATVYRPHEQKDALPVIFTLTPYISDSYIDRATYFSRNGYVYALVDVRGRGNSEGRFEPFANEGRDGYDIVEWLVETALVERQGGDVGRVVRGVRSMVHAEGISAASDDDRARRGRASGCRLPVFP